MNRSVFPEQIDTFVEHFDIQANDVPDVQRYQTLKMKVSLTTNEQTELQNLTVKLREKIFTPEDFNKLQDCITNLEKFFRDNVQGYIIQKQSEMQAYVDNKQTEMDNYTDIKQTEMETSKTNALNEMTTTKNNFEAFVNTKERNIMSFTDNAIQEMTDKKNYFTNYVNTKQDEVRILVQEFDSNTARYYTTWEATDGQTVFNIFNGSNSNIPPEANLNIPAENIDLIINGVAQTPYVDYIIVNDGYYDKIQLTSNAFGLIQAGTEVFARWYKNVGKLYFTHGSSHSAGGSDPITVTEDMLENNLRNKLNLSDIKIGAGYTLPSRPAHKEVFIDLSE